jgi:hypothetical protein
MLAAGVEFPDWQLTDHTGTNRSSAEMAGSLTSAGFEIEEIIEREPYPDVEHQSRRSYIFARRPQESA